MGDSLRLSTVSCMPRPVLVQLLEEHARAGSRLDLRLDGREWAYPLSCGEVAYLVLDLLVLGEGVAPWSRGVQWDLAGEGRSTEARLLLRPAAPRELAAELQWQARGHARRHAAQTTADPLEGRDFEAHYRAFQLDLDQHVRRFDALAQLFIDDLLRALPLLCSDEEQEACVLERLRATAGRFCRASALAAAG